MNNLRIITTLPTSIMKDGKIPTAVSVGSQVYYLNKTSTLKVFEKGLVCVKCGIEGNVFYLYGSEHWQDYKASMCLYHIGSDDSGKIVLMTRDHILALADGGTNDMNNLQTMCAPCNAEKSSEKDKKRQADCLMWNLRKDKLSNMYSQWPMKRVFAAAIKSEDAYKELRVIMDVCQEALERFCIKYEGWKRL